jgi:hypothetical protein
MFLFQAVTTTQEAVQVGDVITELNSYASTVDLSSASWDLLLILFFLVASFVYGLTLGRDRVILVLLSMYLSMAVINAAPFIDNLTPLGADTATIFYYRIGIFLALFVALFFLLARSAVLQSLARSDAPRSLWQVLLFSMLHVGLLISITISFIPEELHTELSTVTREWFVGQESEFFWVVAPIIAMALIRGSGKRKIKF